MRARLLALALVAAACGDGSEQEGDLIEGKWIVEDDQFDCAFGLVLDGDQFETDYICTLESGNIAIEASAGTYELDDGEFVFRTTHGSCPGSPSTERMAYKLKGDLLTVTRPAGVVVFERLAEGDGPGSSGSATYGCFDDDGFFQPMPVSKL
jgi:hypothetical protein